MLVFFAFARHARDHRLELGAAEHLQSQPVRRFQGRPGGRAALPFQAAKHSVNQPPDLVLVVAMRVARQVVPQVEGFTGAQRHVLVVV